MKNGTQTERDTEMGGTSRGGTSSYNPGLRSFGPHKVHNSRDSSKVGGNSKSGMIQLASLMNRSEQTRWHKKLQKDFIHEMRTLAKLRHPNITTTMGAVLTRGQEPMLVMEYMENGSLYEAMRNETLNLNSQEDILIIAQDIAHGMRFLHSADVIHGDLKSKNVLIDSNLRAKVADFGYVRCVCVCLFDVYLFAYMTTTNLFLYLRLFDDDFNF